MNNVNNSPIFKYLSDIKFVYKTADEIVNNSNVVQSDDELLFAIGVGEVWYFEIHIYMSTGNANTGFREQISAPAGASGLWSTYINPTSTAASTQKAQNFGSSKDHSIANNESGLTYIRGIVINGATAGNVTYYWSQTTAQAVDTTVKAGSHIIAIRLK